MKSIRQDAHKDKSQQLFTGQSNMKKQKKWIKFRHKVVRNILFCTLGLYTKLKYNIKVDKFKGQENRPYLILFNHQTAFDQFFVGMSFRGPVYYLASEDLFSNGKVSSIIKYLVAPIPIKKQTTDVRAILNCMKVAKEGGTIAIAPEGNRTYSGRTGYMSPSIAPLARKLGLPVVLYRIEGGYGVHPRWSDSVRRGKMHSYVSRVISPEEYAEMTDEQLVAEIERGLYVDEATVDGEYKGNRLAEYLERSIYVCPYHGLSRFESDRNVIKCLECGRRVRYTKSKELFGEGFDFPFRFVNDWYEHQSSYINSIDPRTYTDAPIYDETVDLYEVIPYDRKRPIEHGVTLSLFGDGVKIGDTSYPFDRVSALTVLGRNKLNMYHDGKIYQMKGDKRFCALKFVNLFHRYKNIEKGNENGKFLGI